MNNNQLVLLSPEKLLTRPGLKRLEEIREFSLLPSKRIGWNYPLDYLFVDLAIERLNDEPKRVVDIGCGPGAIHGFIEHKYDIEVLGIDLQRWEVDYVDHVGNFLDSQFRESVGLYSNSQDIVFSASSLEHQTLEDHQAAIEIARSILRPGGTLVATVAAAKSESYLTKDPWQWNLSQSDLERVYGLPFENFSFDLTEREYHRFPILTEGYEERFRTAFPAKLPYLSVGFAWTKPT